MIRMRYIDRSKWNDGPWRDEPDYLDYIEPLTGLRCVIRRVEWSGHLNGYVGVKEGHPAFGKHYEDLDEEIDDVHGGLSLSNQGKLALSRDDHDVWWVGFDTMHLYDIQPSRSLQVVYPESSYKGVAYMEIECLKLAQGLQAMEEKLQRAKEAM